MKHLATVPGALIAGLSLLSAQPSAAHHSYAIYDGLHLTTITGTVKDFQWTNPHTYIDVMVPGTDSEPVHWSLEMGSPLVLREAGWKRDSLHPGDKITAIIHQRRDGTNGGSVLEVKFPDGSVIRFKGDRAAAAAAEAAGQVGAPP